MPNYHAARLEDLTPEAGAHVIATALRIAQAIRLGDLSSEGFNLFMSDGECAGQEVAHIHLHVLPRFSEDCINVNLGRESLAPTPTALTATAREIRKHMGCGNIELTLIPAKRAVLSNGVSSTGSGAEDQN